MRAPRKRSISLLTSGQFLAALALLSACTIVLFFLEFRREKVRALEAVESSLAERLNALERFVAQFAGPTGRFIIATEGAQVLADSGGVSRGDALSLPGVLPAGPAGETGSILEGRRALSPFVGGTYVYSRKLDSAPWEFIHLLRESDLASHISPTRMTYGIALLLFSFFPLLTWSALRQRAEAASARAR